MKKRHEQKLVILSIILWVSFNFPVLFLYQKQGQVLGFPILYFYVFSVWSLSIIVSYLILKRHFE